MGYSNKEFYMLINYIQRTARKTLAITIDDKGEVIVKAPKNMSDKDIFKFVNSKQKWIEQKVNFIKTQNAMFNDLFNYNSVLFCGKKYNILRDRHSKDITLKDDYLIIKPLSTLKREAKQIEKFLKNKCIEIVGQRLKYFANIMQLEPNKVVLNNSKRKWGTCDSEGVISFNWRVIMLSPQLIDYVVVHELSHLVEMNHSPAFWAIVSAVLPNVKNLRHTLKQCNFVLQQFRELPV